MPSTGAQSSAAQTIVSAAPADLGDCDYWIVSSRNCGGTNSSPDAGRCLLYLHRTSEQNLVRERREAFLASVRPDRPVCFVMHGSYNRWGDVMVESRRIHRWLRSAAPELPLQVVFFTWPSDGNMPFIFPVDIAILGRRSSAHGAYLAGLISQLPADQRVAIVGHSHGARTAVAALHLLGGGALEEGPALPAGSTYPRQVRAVLIAAAIDHNWLNPGQRYGQALLVPERVLLLRNSRDSTLAIYPMRKLMGDRALGKDGLGQDDRFALGSLGPKVIELNAAEFADWHHSFADYHQRPELAKAMLPWAYFQEDGSFQGTGASTTVVPTGPTIGSPNRPSINSPTSPAVRLAPAAKPPEAASESDSSSEKQKAGEDRADEEEIPEIPRIGVELRVEP
ncbi:MAG TPA: alpha/beta hydrolase [Pirellulaceae bacterium]|nr:alpha/beta hydrolase [Pirellulaceae bacterium]